MEKICIKCVQLNIYVQFMAPVYHHHHHHRYILYKIFNQKTIVILVCKQISSDPLKKDYLQTIDLQIISITIQLYGKKNVKMLSTNSVFTNYIYLIYMYKQNLALNNLQWLICHKTQPNQIIYI